MALILKNRYEVVERIGRGGMAEIFRAIIRGPAGFEKEVCIKRILPPLGGNPGFESMFLDEARIAALLHHANIVQVFDFDRDEEGSFFIVMEYVDGANLKTVLHRAAGAGRLLPPGFAVFVARGVLQGLHHAWTREVDGRSLNVVHRDLSPHNVLISKDGEVKITDFGIAKAVTSAVRTRTGVVKGKIAYMSPEHAAGKRTDGRSDLYALGIVLWETLSGTRLFGRAADDRRPPTPSERRSIPNPAALRPDVPESLGLFVGRLLAPDPEERFAGALEALEALELAGAEPLSPLIGARLVRELGCFDRGGAEEEAKETPGASLSPPHSDTTLKPLPTSSTATIHEEGSRRGKAAFRLRLLVPLIAVVFVLAAAGVLFSHVLARHWGGVRPAVRSGEGAPAAPPQETHAESYDTGFLGGPGVAPTMPSEPPVVSPGPMDTAAPQEKAAPATPAPPPAASGQGAAVRKAVKGWVSINVRPWAEITIDGKKLGYTPLKRHALPAGTHKVVLSNPKLGAEKKLSVTVTGGKESTILLDLTP
jgi:serine/threonine protein kinase